MKWNKLQKRIEHWEGLKRKDPKQFKWIEFDGKVFIFENDCCGFVLEDYVFDTFNKDVLGAVEYLPESTESLIKQFLDIYRLVGYVGDETHNNEHLSVFKTPDEEKIYIDPKLLYHFEQMADNPKNLKYYCAKMNTQQDKWFGCKQLYNLVVVEVYGGSRLFGANERTVGVIMPVRLN